MISIKSVGVSRFYPTLFSWAPGACMPLDFVDGHHSALHNYACSIAIGVFSISSQGLLQSVPSLQVSVAMPYYSIVMVSIGSSSGS